MYEANHGVLDACRVLALLRGAFPKEDANGTAKQAAGEGPQNVVYAADASEGQYVLQHFDHQCDSRGHERGLEYGCPPIQGQSHRTAREQKDVSRTLLEDRVTDPRSMKDEFLQGHQRNSTFPYHPGRRHEGDETKAQEPSKDAPREEKPRPVDLPCPDLLPIHHQHDCRQENVPEQEHGDEIAKAAVNGGSGPLHKLWRYFELTHRRLADVSPCRGPTAFSNLVWGADAAFG